MTNELLREASALFRQYEAHHRAKGTPVSMAKAEVNADIAGRIEAELAAPSAETQGSEREAIARIIDPDGWAFFDRGFYPDLMPSRTKADAILALRRPAAPAPVAGERVAVTLTVNQEIELHGHKWVVKGIHLGAEGQESLIHLEGISHAPGWTGPWETHPMLFVPEVLLSAALTAGAEPRATDAGEGAYDFVRKLPPVSSRTLPFEVVVPETYILITDGDGGVTEVSLCRTGRVIWAASGWNSHGRHYPARPPMEARRVIEQFERHQAILRPAAPDADKPEPREGEAVKRTMTLNLTDAEMAALEELVSKKGSDGPKIFRDSFKLYQAVERGVASVTWRESGPLGLPYTHPPKPDARLSVAVEGEWQSIETAPKDGTPFYARHQSPYRFQPYKPNSQERRNGKRGRWQTMNEYGGWENCSAPVGDWKPHPDFAATALRQIGSTEKGEGK